MLPTNVSSMAKSSDITSFNKTNSVIVSLPGKQLFEIYNIITIITISTAKRTKQYSKTIYYYLSKHSSFIFRINITLLS